MKGNDFLDYEGLAKYHDRLSKEINISLKQIIELIHNQPTLDHEEVFAINGYIYTPGIYNSQEKTITLGKNAFYDKSTETIYLFDD